MFQHCAAQDWKAFGEENPYFGVLSRPEYSGRTLAEPLRDEFFASGDVHVRQLIEVLKNLFGDIAIGNALDFGCGVGRITQAMGREFDSVVGLDIAPGMLAEARRNALANCQENLTYANSLDQNFLQPESYDLVHSYIVLQHIPVACGEPIIEQLIKSVRAGGIGALHMTILPATGRFKSSLRNFVKRNRVLRTFGNLAMGRSWNSLAMEMNHYRVERIIEMLARHGIERFHSIRVDDWGSIGIFFLFRKEPDEAGSSPWSNPVRK
ncbi:class I SAM-dependent methyltransferase [Tsuneonella sp. HG249]